jgi:ribose-phosphate pyrophosphokinase
VEHPSLTDIQKRVIYLASGSTHPELARAVAAFTGLELRQVELRRFPNTEQYVRYGESVRGKHVFILQTLAVADGRSVNDSLVELMLLVDAAKRASAAEITVITPYLAYSRQDRKARGREPISAAAVIKTLACMGAHRIVSVDMHSAQTQATFDGPFDHITAEPLIRVAMEHLVKANPQCVIVSPDGGRAKASEDFAEALGVGLVYMPKAREHGNSSNIIRPKSVAGVKGRECLMIDDMIDTAGTLVSAAEVLHRSGAKRIVVAATHGLLSHPALERLQQSPIDQIIVTDTVPQDAALAALGDKLTVLSCAPLIGRTISEIATGGSVSQLFNDRNYR